MWLLSRAAIKKHSIEIIVVAGFYGTEIVREGVYDILSTKYIVRRNTNRIMWDMSIPLALLGYKDKRRSLYQWILLIFRVIGTLLFARKNPHKLILSANCTFPETAKFWADLLQPDCLVVLNYDKKSKLIENLLAHTKQDGILIYDKDLVDQKYIKNLTIENTYSYGKVKADLIYDTGKKQLTYSQNTLIVPTIVPSVAYPLISAIFITSLKNGLSFSDVAIEALKFDLGLLIANRVKSNIEKE